MLLKIAIFTSIMWFAAPSVEEKLQDMEYQHNCMKAHQASVGVGSDYKESSDAVTAKEYCREVVDKRGDR